MKTLTFSILINASPKKVWDVMLSDKQYREWAAEFMPGSFFTGDWTKGSKMQFLGPNENGKVSGMTSIVADNVPHELISIHHIGLITEGVEDTTSSEAKKWEGYEKYRFIDSNGQCELQIEIDVNNDFVDYMSETWPKALQKLKELVEQ